MIFESCQVLKISFIKRVSDLNHSFAKLSLAVMEGSVVKYVHVPRGKVLFWYQKRSTNNILYLTQLASQHKSF